MRTNLNSPVFHLCWLRESAAGHLDCDLGTPLPADRLELGLLGLAPERCTANVHELAAGHVERALGSVEEFQRLPKWLAWKLTEFFGSVNTPERARQAAGHFLTVRRLCDQARAAADGRLWTELHLPYFSRRDWADRFAILSGLQFTRTSDAITAIGAAHPQSLEALLLRASAGVFQPQGDQRPPLRWTQRQPIEQPWASMLAQRWGTALPPGADKFDGIELELPFHAIDAWRKSPRLHHGRHHSVWSRVALAVQWILRRWSLALQLSNGGPEVDREGCLHSMMYHAMRPWAENARSELSYDVLDEAQMRIQFRKSARRLQFMLDSTGVIEFPESTELLLEAAKIANRCLLGRSVRGMLSAEESIVNALMRYSQDVKAAQTPRHLRKCTGDVTAVFDEQLPRIFRRNRPEHIGSAIFLEATNAMYTALGGAPLLDARFRPAEDGDQAPQSSLTGP